MLMRLKSCIRWVEVIIVGLLICLIASIAIRCGYLIVLSIGAILFSLHVYSYLIETRKSEFRKASSELKRLVIIEQNKQEARDELFEQWR